MEKKAYKVKFIEYEITNGHVEYTAKVVANKGSDTFHIRDRYSSMRSYWKSMYAKYGNSTPTTFPPKKWFGNTKAMFVRHRMEELEHFFNATLEDPELAMSKITQNYFKRKKVQLKDFANHIKSTEEKKEMERVYKRSEPKGVTLNDKKWRQIVDEVTKECIDICLGEEPIPPEEVKRRSIAYSEALNPSLSTLAYLSKILSLPKSDDKGLNLSLICAEQEISEWLDNRMAELIKVVENRDKVYEREGEVLNEFEAEK
jgi:hypothetical protein